MKKLKISIDENQLLSIFKKIHIDINNQEITTHEQNLMC